MNSTSIPVNDPKHPRWLVDLEEWETIPFTEIPQETFLLEGYGVVSYTWGYIVDKGNPAPNPPRGLLWDVPGIKGWTLPEIRDIMRKSDENRMSLHLVGLDVCSPTRPRNETIEPGTSRSPRPGNREADVS